MLSKFFYTNEDTKWSINGTLKLDKTFKSDEASAGTTRPEHAHEIQYNIHPPPEEVEDRKNFTHGNAVIPVFIWRIHLKRLLMPYVVEAFIPTGVLVMVSWTSFLISPECVPGRVGLLVTLLLVLTNIYLYELNHSPSTSCATALDAWNQICLTMVALAILEYAGILYTMRFTKQYSSEEAMGADNVTLSGDLEPLINIGERHNMADYKLHTNGSRGEEQPKQIEGNKGRLHVPQRALIIDHYSLVLIPISFFIITVTFFVYYCTPNA